MRSIHAVTQAFKTASRENQRITQTHYGKFSPERRFEVLESIADNETFVPTNLTDAEKIEAFDVLSEFLFKNARKANEPTDAKKPG
ncbi:MAG: hypothetical protein AB8B51_09610 [Sedimentitalea sp.]